MTWQNQHFAMSSAHGRIQRLCYYVFASIIHTKSGFSESTVVDEWSGCVSSTVDCTTKLCSESSLSKIGLADDVCRWQNINNSDLYNKIANYYQRLLWWVGCFCVLCRMSGTRQSILSAWWRWLIRHHITACYKCWSIFARSCGHWYWDSCNLCSCRILQTSIAMKH